MALIFGSKFNDILVGTNSDDTIIDMDGNDTIVAGAGNDTIFAGKGSDFISGGDGVDTLHYGLSNAAVNVNLGTSSATGGQGNDTLVNIENVVGSDLADTLTGNAGNNTLDGAAGADTLRAGAGNDTLIGNAGNDNMSGQGGNDVFRWMANVFNSADVTFGGIDKITDFNAGDKVDFTSALEAIMQVNGVALGSTASNVALGHAFNATTNVCMSGNDLCIDLDNSHSFTANDFHIQVVGSAGNMTYDAAADTFHI